MSEAIKQIENLNHEAKFCKDPARLRQIADALQELGQWLDSKAAANRAYEIERQFATEAMK